jgi:hypothetical protein
MLESREAMEWKRMMWPELLWSLWLCIWVADASRVLTFVYYKHTLPSEPNAHLIAMDNFHPRVLLATARIKAALGVAAQIVGPKEAWATWMRDELDGELVCMRNRDP